MAAMLMLFRSGAFSAWFMYSGVYHQKKPLTALSQFPRRSMRLDHFQRTWRSRSSVVWRGGGSLKRRHFPRAPSSLKPEMEMWVLSYARVNEARGLGLPLAAN
jgi:hypothetical protein